MALFGRGTHDGTENDDAARGEERDARDHAADHAADPAAAPVRRDERLAEGLGLWAERKDRRTLAEVLRRALTGQLLLDISDSEIADPSSGLQRGDRIAIAAQTDNAGRQLLMAFTENEELTRYRGRPGISLVQPAAAVLAQAARDFEGIAIDPRAEHACIVYAEEILQHFADDPEALVRATAATTTAATTTAATATAATAATATATPTANTNAPTAERSPSDPGSGLFESLVDAPLFVPVIPERDASGAETGAARVMSAQDDQGRSFAVAGTSPAELWAWRAEAEAHRVALAQLADLVQGNGLAGLQLNPGGPGVFVPAEELRPFVSTAGAGAGTGA